MASLQRAITIDVSGLQCQFTPAQGANLTHSHSANDAVLIERDASFERAIKCLAGMHLEKMVTVEEGISVGENKPGCVPASPFYSADSDIVQTIKGSVSDSAQPGAACLSSYDTDALHSTISTLAASLPNMSLCHPVPTACPFGVKAVIGKRSRMEDAFQVQTNLIGIPSSNASTEDKFPARIAFQLASIVSHCSSEETATSAGTAAPVASTSASTDQQCADSVDKGQTLHFFGVYDGHGGDQAANHCAARLHQHFTECLANAALSGKAAPKVPSNYWLGADPPAAAAAAATGSCGSIVSIKPGPHDLPKCALRTVDSSSHLDVVSQSGESNESAGVDSASSPRQPDTDDAMLDDTAVEDALRDAFLRTDEEFGTDCCASMVGTTAVVALLGQKRIWVANCGDSRAVMCRGGKCIQLTDDHKPEREDEAARVEKAGGQVLYWNGHRVMGVLAMSRAIGDHGLRPYVISDPEISVVNRCGEDEFLLLASDGLWDVMENQEATNLAVRCMARTREKGAGRKAAVRIAASVLTKAAIDRGSKDNVTVLIVDLMKPGEPTAAAAATVAAAVPGGMDLASLPEPYLSADDAATPRTILSQHSMDVNEMYSAMPPQEPGPSVDETSCWTCATPPSRPSADQVEASVLPVSLTSTEYASSGYHPSTSRQGAGDASSCVAATQQSADISSTAHNASGPSIGQAEADMCRTTAPSLDLGEAAAAAAEALAAGASL